jgi:hypothetical protein
MSIGRRLTIPPATAIAVMALFFALGGSAFAVGERVQAALANQQRCANGAVRGVAVVTGNPAVGIANIPDQFTSAANLFSRRFNCTGRAIQIRRTAIGVFEVRFVGNAATTAIVGGLGGGYASADPARGGVFTVRVYPSGIADPADRGFIVVLV